MSDDNKGSLFDQIAAEAVQRAIEKAAENAVQSGRLISEGSLLRDEFMKHVKRIMETEEFQVKLRERLHKAIDDLPMTLTKPRGYGY